MHYQKVILLLFLFVLSLTAGEPLTLEQCLDAAVQHSRLLQNSERSVAIAKARRDETAAQRLPALSITAQYAHIGEVTSFTIPMGPTSTTFQFGASDRINADAGVQMPLYTFGRIESAVSISEEGIRLSEVQKKEQLTALTEQVYRAFFSLLLNQRIFEIEQKSVDRAGRFVEISQQRFAAGQVPESEVRVQQIQAQAARDAAAADMRTTSLWLAKLIGSAEPEIQVAGIMAIRDAAESSPRFVERALEQRGEIARATFQQAMERQQLRLAELGNYPTFILNGHYTLQNGFDPTDPQRLIDNWNAGVVMSFPLFDGFASSHRAQQARLQLENTRVRGEETADLIRLQVNQALSELDKTISQANRLQENVVLAGSLAEVVEKQYRAGTATSLELLNAQQTVAMSEKQLVLARFAHVMARIDLARACNDFTIVTEE
jgi:outer membrane protein